MKTVTVEEREAEEKAWQERYDAAQKKMIEERKILKTISYNAMMLELQSRGMIRVTWCVDDIIERAKEQKKKVTKKQAKEIAGLIERRHDCNIGLSWEVLDIFIDDYLL